jgi:hypothetical protein
MRLCIMDDVLALHVLLYQTFAVKYFFLYYTPFSVVTINLMWEV